MYGVLSGHRSLDRTHLSKMPHHQRRLRGMLSKALHSRSPQMTTSQQITENILLQRRLPQRHQITEQRPNDDPAVSSANLILDEYDIGVPRTNVISANEIEKSLVRSNGHISHSDTIIELLHPFGLPTERSTTSNKIPLSSSDVIEQYADIPVSPVNLSSLLLKHSQFKKGRNSENNSSSDKNILLLAANSIKMSFMVRLAKDVQRVWRLPFGMGTNPQVSWVYDGLRRAFEELCEMPTVTTVEANTRLCSFLSTLVSPQVPVIPHLALGLSRDIFGTNINVDGGSARIVDIAESFMEDLCHALITRQILAEHHIALTALFERQRHCSSGGAICITERSHFKDDEINKLSVIAPVGVVGVNVLMKEVISRCISQASTWFSESYGSAAPPVVIDGLIHARVPTVVSAHIEYIVLELVKNAMTASIDMYKHGNVTFRAGQVIDKVQKEISDRSTLNAHSPNSTSATDLYKGTLGCAVEPCTVVYRDPILITLALSSKVGGGGGGGSSIGIGAAKQHNQVQQKQQQQQILTVRVSDRSGGLSAKRVAGLGRWTTAASFSDDRRRKRNLGVGLPMSRAYARWLENGNLDVVAMEGGGLDVYVVVPVGGECIERMQTY